jgi:hypothetical protein
MQVYLNMLRKRPQGRPSHLNEARNLNAKQEVDYTVKVFKRFNL